MYPQYCIILVVGQRLSSSVQSPIIFQKLNLLQLTSKLVSIFTADSIFVSYYTFTFKRFPIQAKRFHNIVGS